MTTSTPTIDPEFKDLIPPLSPDERKTLEESIKREGCHTAIVLWNSIVIDGHNRLEICTKNSLRYSTVEIHLADRLVAQIWILNNQLGRRNLSDKARMDLALLLKSQLAVEAQVRMKAGKKSDPVETLPQGTGRTRDRAAKMAGVSGKTLDKYEKVVKEGTPELVAATRAGKISVNAAAKAVKATAAPKQAKVTSESKPAQEVPEKAQGDTKARKISWRSDGKTNWIAHARYRDCAHITKRTIKGEVHFEVSYEYYKRKDKAPSLQEAKALGELFIGWRDEVARRAGR